MSGYLFRRWPTTCATTRRFDNEKKTLLDEDLTPSSLSAVEIWGQCETFLSKVARRRQSRGFRSLDGLFWWPRPTSCHQRIWIILESWPRMKLFVESELMETETIELTRLCALHSTHTHTRSQRERISRFSHTHTHTEHDVFTLFPLSVSFFFFFVGLAKRDVGPERSNVCTFTGESYSCTLGLMRIGSRGTSHRYIYREKKRTKEKKLNREKGKKRRSRSGRGVAPDTRPARRHPRSLFSLDLHSNFPVSNLSLTYCVYLCVSVCVCVVVVVVAPCDLTPASCADDESPLTEHRHYRINVSTGWTPCRPRWRALLWNGVPDRPDFPPPRLVRPTLNDEEQTPAELGGSYEMAANQLRRHCGTRSARQLLSDPLNRPTVVTEERFRNCYALFCSQRSYRIKKI